MKIIAWIIGGLFALTVGMFGLQYVASERVEVVELHTIDENGEPVTTRLWVVDDEGYQYLRVGAGGSGWLDRIQENGEFQVTRNDVTKRFIAVLREEKGDRINQLMNEKYTWGDDLISALLGSRENSIPIELTPLD